MGGFGMGALKFIALFAVVKILSLLMYCEKLKRM